MDMLNLCKQCRYQRKNECIILGEGINQLQNEKCSIFTQKSLLRKLKQALLRGLWLLLTTLKNFMEYLIKKILDKY